MAEYDGLSRAPVLVEYLHTIFGCDRRHSGPPASLHRVPNKIGGTADDYSGLVQSSPLLIKMLEITKGADRERRAPGYGPATQGDVRIRLLKSLRRKLGSL